MANIAVVLGSGLGSFSEALADRVETPYSQIAGWPVSTAIGHPGKLIGGRLGSTDVLVLAGRAHLYEGYTPHQVTFGIRELARRGVKSVILTNAAGGINRNYEPGQLVLISDHINLMGVNPLTGPNDDRIGPRFPDMSDAYSREYREIARQAGREMGLNLEEGVYAAMGGPSYETPAEIRYLRTIGADLVGMSTVPEAIVANYLGLRVLGISCVTNMAAGVLPERLNHADVLKTSERVRDTLVKLLKLVVPRLEPSAQVTTAADKS